MSNLVLLVATSGEPAAVAFDVLANAGQVTATGLLVWLLYMLASGRLVTRRTANAENAAMREAYEVLEMAHSRERAAMERELADALADLERLRKVGEARQRQMGVLLDEIAPTLRAWSDATAQRAGVGDGNGVER